MPKFEVVRETEYSQEGRRTITVVTESRQEGIQKRTFPKGSILEETEDGRTAVTYFEDRGKKKVKVTVVYGYGEVKELILEEE